MANDPRGWRSGLIPHDLPDVHQLPFENQSGFLEVMEHLGGGITFEEAQFLYNQASVVKTGCIVEVGAFKGRSAVALSMGARHATRESEEPTEIFCIEPHAKFIGVNGGIFGPQDRGEFYKAMLSTRSFENTALVNLSSEIITPQWSRPVQLCFIDGDHTYEGVKRDFECWKDKISMGGILVLDDTIKPNLGPFKLIKEIAEMPEWSPIDAPGKFAAFIKS